MIYEGFICVIFDKPLIHINLLYFFLFAESLCQSIHAKYGLIPNCSGDVYETWTRSMCMSIYVVKIKKGIVTAMYMELLKYKYKFFIASCYWEMVLRCINSHWPFHPRMNFFKFYSNQSIKSHLHYKKINYVWQMIKLEVHLTYIKTKLEMVPAWVGHTIRV